MKKKLLIILVALMSTLITSCEKPTAPLEPEIEQGGGDISSLQKNHLLNVESGSASSFHSGTPFENSYDGSFSTAWHSNWNNTGADYYPITAQWNLEDSDKPLDYLIYSPSTSHWNGNGIIKRVEIDYNTYDNSEWVSLGEFDFKGSMTSTKVDFPSVDRPKSVRFTILSARGDGQGFAGCLEMQFFSYNSASRFDNIFTDGSLSELKEGVTMDDINSIENGFVREIARSIYEGTYPTKDRIKSYEAYEDPNHIASTYKMRPYGRFDNVTGITVEAGDTVVVFCGPSKQNLSIGVGYNFDGGGGECAYHTLIPNFTNVFVSEVSGLLYVMYHVYESNEALAALEDVTVHIATGSVNGYFRQGEHTNEDWGDILLNAKYPYLDVQGARSHWHARVEDLKLYVNDPEALTRAYDELIYTEQEIMGLHKYNMPIKARSNFVAVDHGYMYATSYRTCYNFSTMSSVLNPVDMSTGRNWGPAHELGHAYQIDGLTWIGTTEVTTNIYSLYVQTTQGAESRLESDDRYIWAFDKMFTNSSTADNYTDCSIWEFLCMFWQLHLYSDVCGVDFYKDLSQSLRNSQAGSDGEQVVNFMIRASQIFELDLTDYFTSWRMLEPMEEVIEDYATRTLVITQAQVDAAKAEMAKFSKPTHEIRYIRDNNKQLYVTPQAVVQGTVVDSGSSIQFQGWRNCVAYELWDKDGLHNVNTVDHPNVEKSLYEHQLDMTTAYGVVVGADGSRVRIDL